MKRLKHDFEMPFGAKDSELIWATYTIPEGFHAVIEGNKVIMKKGEKPSTLTAEDDKMMDIILNDINYAQKNFSDSKLTPYDKKVEWLKSHVQNK